MLFILFYEKPISAIRICRKIWIWPLLVLITAPIGLILKQAIDSFFIENRWEWIVRQGQFKLFFYFPFYWFGVNLSLFNTLVFLAASIIKSDSRKSILFRSGFIAISGLSFILFVEAAYKPFTVARYLMWFGFCIFLQVSLYLPTKKLWQVVTTGIIVIVLGYSDLDRSGYYTKETKENYRLAAQEISNHPQTPVYCLGNANYLNSYYRMLFGKNLNQLSSDADPYVCVLTMAYLKPPSFIEPIFKVNSMYLLKIKKGLLKQLKDLTDFKDIKKCGT